MGSCYNNFADKRLPSLSLCDYESALSSLQLFFKHPAKHIIRVYLLKLVRNVNGSTGQCHQLGLTRQPRQSSEDRRPLSGNQSQKSAHGMAEAEGGK